MKGVADFEGVLVVVDVGGIEIVVSAVVFLEVGQDVGQGLYESHYLALGEVHGRIVPSFYDL